jgi:hypothetical protein
VRPFIPQLFLCENSGEVGRSKLAILPEFVRLFTIYETSVNFLLVRAFADDYALPLSENVDCIVAKFEESQTQIVVSISDCGGSVLPQRGNAVAAFYESSMEVRWVKVNPLLWAESSLLPLRTTSLSWNIDPGSSEIGESNVLRLASK